MRKTKHRSNVIIIVCLLTVLMVSSLILASYAWFFDKKEADMNITVSQSTKGSVSISNENKLVPSDLIAGNEYSKTITINFSSNVEVAFRTYAIVSTECYENGTKTTKNNIVSLTNVSNSKKGNGGNDNKFYYSLDGTNLSGITSGTTSLTYSFKVATDFNDEIFRNSSGEIDTTLKTTIEYFVEYCQKTNVDDWD